MMKAHRSSLAVHVALAGLLIVVGAGCCSTPRMDPVAHIPSAAERQHITVTPAWSDTGLKEAVKISVCLLETADPADCRNGEPVEVCNTLGAARIEAAVRPFLSHLSELKLENPYSARGEVRDLGLDATPTLAVTDARRAVPCESWTDTAPGCLAVLVPVVRGLGLWVILHPKPGGAAGVEKIELFPAGDPCSAELGRLR